jgi:2-dehydropantoate 2-reductase
MHNGMGTVDELKSVKQPLLLARQPRRRAATATSSSTSPTAPRISARRKLSEDYSYLADVLQSVLPDVAWHNNIPRQPGASWRLTA